MKNARSYEKAVKKLLSDIKKSASKGQDRHDTLETLIRAVLEEDATVKAAERAERALREEYVDFNELRVAQSKEIVECIGKDYPDARRKAEQLRSALNGIYYHCDRLWTGYMEEMTKRDLRQHLLEVGLGQYAAACVTLLCFGGHAVAVDERLLAHLKGDGYIHPEADAEEAQKFLERVIPLKDAVAAHSYLRRYAQKKPKPVPKKAPKKKAKAKTKKKTAKKKKTKKKKAAAKKSKAKSKKKKKKTKAKKKPKKKAAGKKSRAKKSRAKKTKKTGKKKKPKKSVKKKPSSRRKKRKKSARTKKTRKSSKR